jgi:manganese/zinc/iron transport system permease protein
MDGLLQFARENYNLLVVLAGSSLLGIGAGIIGAFAVLRKRALTGDALSHAALPGLCIAFLILRERNLIALLLGALASGVVGIAIISALGRWTRVRGDAAIGAVLTVFFGLGVVLLKIIQNLPGVGSRAGLNSYIFGKTAGMTQSDVYVILAAAAICLALIVLFYKEFQLVSFDADFAQALGWPVYGVDLLLMSLVAAAVVIGLPSVGVILVSALLIMPGAAARFWTDRLSTLLALAGAFGLAMGLAGTLLSAAFDSLPTGPIIVLVGTAIFAVSLLFGSRRGALARWFAHLRFQRQWRERQLLRTIFDALEADRPPRGQVTRQALLASRAWTPAQLERILAGAASDNLVALHGEKVALTAAGARQAVEVARGQRLWQEFLTEYPEQAGSVVNLASISVGEFVPPAAVEALVEKLRAEGRWPREEQPA